SFLGSIIFEPDFFHYSDQSPISRYLGLRAPTPRSVPRHGNFLLDPAISVSPRDRPNPAGAQRLLIAGSNKKSRCRRATAVRPSAARPLSRVVTVTSPRITTQNTPHTLGQSNN
ncbi:MAG: hypothetical protein RSC11_03150, partial [Mucinivorans sp.]